MPWDWVFWWASLVPLAVYTARDRKPKAVPHVWRAVALAFAVSWLADAASLVLPSHARWAVSLGYPVAQALLVASAVLSRGNTARFAGLLLASSAAALLQLGPWLPDTLVRTVAWIGGGAISWDAKISPRLRASLVITFGLGWLAWVSYVYVLSVPLWFAYQGVRMLGIGSYVVALVWEPA